MNTLDAKEAGEKLDRLLDEAVEAHQPVLITSPRANAVLVAEEDWNAIQKTLYFLSVPGMRESIRAGLETPIEECQSVDRYRPRIWRPHPRTQRRTPHAGLTSSPVTQALLPVPELDAFHASCTGRSACATARKGRPGSQCAP